MDSIPQDLTAYIETEINPQYRAFDPAHREEHVQYVICESLHLASFYDVNPAIVYTAAACHDLGLRYGRKTHHLESGRIIRSDENLLGWFNPDEIETIAQAAEDHRASAENEPRSIYGKIVAEADRQIDAETIMRRTIQYSIAHYPELDLEGHWNRCLQHVDEKYSEGGYLHLWIPESDNARRLKEFQAIIKDRARLRSLFDRLWEKEQ